MIEGHGIDVPVLLDLEGRLARRFGVDAYPQTLVLGLDGEVTARHRGLAGTDEIERSVDDATP